MLPHIDTIIPVAVPVFTNKPPGAADPVVLQQQITELQAAAQNTAHIRELAEKLQNTVVAVEQAAAIADKQLRWALTLCITALLLSTLALGVVLWNLAVS